MGNRHERLEVLRIDAVPERANLSSLALGMGLAGLRTEGVFSWSRSGCRTVLAGVSRADLAAACERMEDRFQSWSIQLTAAALPNLATYALDLAEEATRIRCQTVLNETQSHLTTLIELPPGITARTPGGPTWH